ncbi:Protein O-linked-mannose beta-1,2-N-acetylglucosaminyltransferase [Dirofilaria immitis]
MFALYLQEILKIHHHFIDFMRKRKHWNDWAQLRRNVPANLIDNECMKNAYCPKDEATVLLRSESRTKPPLLCLNNKKLFDSSKLVRGLNIAILNSNKSVIGVHYLSVQDSDFSVIKLLAQVQSYQIIIGTSYGDVSSKISAETRQLLRLFGLSLAQYKTESSILFMGQLGLLVPAAFEKVVPLEIAEPKYHVRCLKSPMGKLANVTIQIPEAHHIDEHVVAQLSAVKGQKMKVNLGAELPNCGHSENCPEDEIPMFFYSGKDKDDSPQLCVNGRLIIDRDLNSAGRGLNLVVIDSKTHQVMRTGHYDTYLEDSSALVLFLEQLSPGEILAVISFDEASNSLSDMAKHIFYELGSSLIYRLKFRASWYFIGQKGIDGYTPFEDMNLASGNDWAKPIRQTICVPSVLDGLKTVNNGLPKTQNMLRRHFCSRYDGYEDFCDESRLDIPLVPRSSQTHLPSTDPIYTVPILLAGGLNMNNIRLCLESIYVQDGINPQNVVVAFDSIYGEISDLSALFHVRALPINNSASYNDFVLEGIDHMMTLFPYAPCIIVIEEDMILLPGFLYFLAQILPNFLKDKTANFILTLNENIVKSRDVDVASVYRIENGTAAGAYVIKKSFYNKFMKNRQCCERTKFGWLISDISYIAAVSRVEHIKTFDLVSLTKNDGTRKEPSKNSNLLNGDEIVENADRLSEESYDAELKEVIENGWKFHVKDYVDCHDGIFDAHGVSNFDNITIATIIIVYDENTSVLSQLAQCFNLYIVNNHPLGSYKGTIQISTKHAWYMLVASHSSLLKAKSEIQTSTSQFLH